tara:strand:- start:15595 stop:16377 length:783 start_codon:yes stop_codon:yes gene_type:complete
MIKYFLPPFFVDCLSFVKNFSKYILLFPEILKNSKLRYSKKGERVFVIANGPSLNNFDITSLYGKEVIVMNNFDLAEWKDKVSIVAHCIGEPKSSDHWGKDQIEIMSNTNAKSYWFHISNSKEVNSSELSNNKNCHYVFSIYPSGLWNNNKEINLAKPVLGYQTTAQLAIMVALHYGYKEIFLIGFDHDWLSNRNISPHFYEERDGVRKADLSVFPYYELINISQTMWKIYMKLKLSANKVNSRIINLSNPSFLDVFEKK